jgi:excinuclease ABC subunit C
MKNLINKVESAPETCGVYIFLKDKKPIYIGKAKNLKERLKAYINFLDTRETVPKIVQEADDVRWIITNTEEDAFFLEQKLISENLPKYNVKVKDIRGLKYIKIDISHQFPSVSLTRIPKKESALYFGPFSAKETKEIFSALKMAFGIRTCTENKFKDFQKRQRPCLDGQIEVCPAPCVGKITRSEYLKNVYRAIDFMKGKFTKVIKELEKKMWEEAEKENFEEAAKIRDKIKIIQKALDYKRIIFEDFRNADYLGYDIIEDKVGIFILKIREGRFFGGYGGVFHYGGQDILDLALKLFFENSGSDGIIVSEIITSDQQVGKILVRPPYDDEKEVMMLAKSNATEQILQTSIKIAKKFRMLTELQKFLLLDKTPRRIEVYDFSNFGGKNLVGVKVHFEDGEIIPSRLRLYKVDEFGYDDISALKNVMSRRIKDFFEGKDLPLPDLILVDGGKSHYSVLKEILKRAKLDIPFGCIKKEERNRRNVSLIFQNQELKPTGNLLSFILYLVNSAHERARRFAVSRTTKIN